MIRCLALELSAISGERSGLMLVVTRLQARIGRLREANDEGVEGEGSIYYYE